MTINIRLGIDRVTKIFVSLQAIENIYSSVIALWLDTHKHTTNIHLTILIRQELPFDHTHTIHTHTHTYTHTTFFCILSRAPTEETRRYLFVRSCPLTITSHTQPTRAHNLFAFDCNHEPKKHDDIYSSGAALSQSHKTPHTLRSPALCPLASESVWFCKFV